MHRKLQFNNSRELLKQSLEYREMYIFSKQLKGTDFIFFCYGGKETRIRYMLLEIF